MLNKKSIVLSDTQKESNKKAVLTLQKQEGGLYGTLRLYNFVREVDGICSVGIYENNKVHKAGLTQKAHMFYEFFVNLSQVPQKFSVAIVNFQNAVAAPILFGSSEGCENDVFAQIISDVSGQKVSVENVTQTLDKFGVDFADDEKKEIEQEIDKALCENNCANCIYKKFFFQNQPSKNNAQVEAKQAECVRVDPLLEQPIFSSKIESSDDFGQYLQKNEEKIEKNYNFVHSNAEETEKPSQNFMHEKEENNNLAEGLFFNKLKPQIDKLFQNHPAEEHLQQLIPSSKWVRVEFEDDGDFYVFGLLYDEDGQVKYVCYGVPAVFEQQPPKELSGYPIWLPLGKEEGFGYWLTYQDASTGQPVKAIMD